MARSRKVVANNKKARHDYFVEETYEAGIALTGTEIKSVRAGRVSIKESYAHIYNGEITILGMHISPYEQGNRFNVEPLRERKLLMHKREIFKLAGLSIDRKVALDNITASKGLEFSELLDEVESIVYSGTRINISLVSAEAAKSFPIDTILVKNDHFPG